MTSKPQKVTVSAKMACMFLAGSVLALFTNGCVTGSTLAAAEDQVTYKSKVENGLVVGSEVDTVKKGHPIFYALVPVAAGADIALLPVYVAGTIAINLGIIPPP